MRLAAIASALAIVISAAIFGAIFLQKTSGSGPTPLPAQGASSDGQAPAVTTADAPARNLSSAGAKAPTVVAIGLHATYEPGLLKQVAAAGHAVGSHTWCHQDLSKTKGRCNVNGKVETVEYDPKDEIEKGISAVRSAVGGPTAPYFRFPALRQPQELMDYLGKRNIGIFSNERRPHAPDPGARTTAPGGPLWSQDTFWIAMPVARRGREKALPDAWRRPWIWRPQGSAQRQLQARPVHRRGDRRSELAEAAHARREGADQETPSALRWPSVSRWVPCTRIGAGHYGVGVGDLLRFAEGRR